MEGISSRVYYRLFKAAHRAISSDGPYMKVAASIIVDGSVYSSHNTYKTHPHMAEASNGRKECLHAEVALLTKFRGRDLRGPMLVIRENTLGLAMAKPCPYCQTYIRKHFQKLKVYYSSESGEILKL